MVHWLLEQMRMLHGRALEKALRHEGDICKMRHQADILRCGGRHDDVLRVMAGTVATRHQQMPVGLLELGNEQISQPVCVL